MILCEQVCWTFQKGRNPSLVPQSCHCRSIWQFQSNDQASLPSMPVRGSPRVSPETHFRNWRVMQQLQSFSHGLFAIHVGWFSLTKFTEVWNRSQAASKSCCFNRMTWPPRRFELRRVMEELSTAINWVIYLYRFRGLWIWKLTLKLLLCTSVLSSSWFNHLTNWAGQSIEPLY